MTPQSILVVVILVVLFALAVVFIAKNGGWDPRETCAGQCASCAARCQERYEAREAAKAAKETPITMTETGTEAEGDEL